VIAYLDVTQGQYENFVQVKTDGRLTHPLRLGLEGRFNVPKIPIFVGFDSNTRVGNSQGDLRFLFGTAFDFGCLLQKVGVNFGAGANAGGSCDTTSKAPSTK